MHARDRQGFPIVLELTIWSFGPFAHSAWPALANQARIRGARKPNPTVDYHSHHSATCREPSEMIVLLIESNIQAIM